MCFLEEIECCNNQIFIVAEQSQRCSKSLCVGTDNKRQFSGFCLEPLVFLTEVVVTYNLRVDVVPN